MSFIYLIFAFLLGIVLSFQSVINTMLREATSNPIFAVTVNFTVGLLTLLAITIKKHQKKTYKMPSLSALRISRWWMWIGGPLGIIFVTAGALIPGYIGYGAFFSMIVAGELLLSATIDHKGCMGNEARLIGKKQILGMFLLLTGAVLVQTI